MRAPLRLLTLSVTALGLCLLAFSPQIAAAQGLPPAPPPGQTPSAQAPAPQAPAQDRMKQASQRLALRSDMEISRGRAHAPHRLTN